MNTQHAQWGEAICLVHALFPELSFQITDPEKLRPGPIAAALHELGIVLQWEAVRNNARCDSDIYQQLISDDTSLKGQALLVCGTCRRGNMPNPFVVPAADLETFVDGFEQHYGESFFADDAVIIIPESQALFLVKKDRQLTRYCNS